MFQINREVKEHLVAENEINDLIGGKTIENFKSHLGTLYKEGNLLDIKKLLGVLYTPIAISMFKEDIEIDILVLEAMGLHTAGVEHLVKIATLMYIDNDFKEHGDSKVCEPLNYVSFENGEIVERYWERI